MIQNKKFSQKIELENKYVIKRPLKNNFFFASWHATENFSLSKPWNKMLKSEIFLTNFYLVNLLSGIFFN